jgi:hypothetical protein
VDHEIKVLQEHSGVASGTTSGGLNILIRKAVPTPRSSPVHNSGARLSQALIMCARFYTRSEALGVPRRHARATGMTSTYPSAPSLPGCTYDWVLKPVIGYSSIDRLLEILEDKIVRPAEAKFNELLARRTEQLRVENV